MDSASNMFSLLLFYNYITFLSSHTLMNMIYLTSGRALHVKINNKNDFQKTIVYGWPSYSILIILTAVKFFWT